MLSSARKYRPHAGTLHTSFVERAAVCRALATIPKIHSGPIDACLGHLSKLSWYVEMIMPFAVPGINLPRARGAKVIQPLHSLWTCRGARAILTM